MPITGPFTAYLHFVSSVWWTAMLVWHLWRYMGAAVRSAGAKRSVPAPRAPGAAVAPVASSD